MPVKRDLWKEALTQTYTPAWHCPACSGGYLKLHKKSFASEDTAVSLRIRNEDDWDPEWLSFRFTAILICNNDSCKESVVLAGNGRVETMQAEEDVQYQEYFYPEYVNPSPRIITLGDDYPELVIEELRKSFAASWGDYSSAITHIRAAVERLLDFLKEPKKRLTKKGYQRISLHERIKGLANRDPELSKLLLAVKWLGNIGSHSAEITRDDVFDAYDILDLVLDDLFVKNRKRVNKLVNTINKKKGPVKK